MAANTFRRGQLHTRADVAEMIGLPQKLRHGGQWDTGYSRWNDEFFIFCNVGIPGTTGHDYPNRWDGKTLLWSGKTGSRAGQPFMAEMLSGRQPVHLFWRGAVRQPFTYAGVATPTEVIDTVPVQVRWAFEGDTHAPGRPPKRGLVWRRGPPPSPGTHTVVKEDRPTELYVMTLEGAPDALLAAAGDGLVPIKVGISNKPDRRLDEMNFGFPPESSAIWHLYATRGYPTGDDAFVAEGKILEALRLSGRWIGGEFAIVPRQELEDVLSLSSEG